MPLSSAWSSRPGSQRWFSRVRTRRPTPPAPIAANTAGSASSAVHPCRRRSTASRREFEQLEARPWPRRLPQRRPPRAATYDAPPARQVDLATPGPAPAGSPEQGAGRPAGTAARSGSQPPRDRIRRGRPNGRAAAATGVEGGGSLGWDMECSEGRREQDEGAIISLPRPEPGQSAPTRKTGLDAADDEFGVALFLSHLRAFAPFTFWIGGSAATAAKSAPEIPESPWRMRSRHTVIRAVPLASTVDADGNQAIFAFDSEDYITPQAADAEVWWAQTMVQARRSRHHLRGGRAGAGAARLRTARRHQRDERAGDRLSLRHALRPPDPCGVPGTDSPGRMAWRRSCSERRAACATWRTSSACARSPTPNRATRGRRRSRRRCD